MSVNVKIPFSSAKHKDLLYRILARFRRSEEYMQRKYDSFRMSEELMTAYIPENEAENARKANWKKGVPDYLTFVIPYAYAQAMTAHTYMASVFLGRNPVFQFEGTDGRAESHSQAVEALMAYQYRRGRMSVPLYNWLMDPLRYGFGALGLYWDRQITRVSRIEERPVTIMGVPVKGKTQKVRVVEEMVKYEGNRVYNISPRNFFPDPSVPLSSLQDGEFCGRTVQVSWNHILKGAENDEYFNVDVLERTRGNIENRDQTYGTTSMEWPAPEDQRSFGYETNAAWVDLLEIVIEISPKDWGLGSSMYPEKWLFTVADRRVIIGARPLGAYHDEYPFYILEYEIEPYNLLNRSLLEITEPLNKVMTWLINSHMYNVRQVLNNQFIVDPTRVNMRDLLEGGPGFIARVRPEAAGQDVRTMIAQLPVTDVTQTHLRDLQYMERLFQIVTGVNDNVMGMLAPGGRKTATEVRQSSSFGVNRLKTIAEYFSAIGWEPLAGAMLQNSQQYYSREQRLRIVGDTTDGSVFVDVSPESIAGEYDFIPVDGTMPVDRFAMANLWRQLFADMQRFPDVISQFDMAGVFSYVARLAGAKNIDQFRVNTMPNESVMQGAEAGNLVPIKDVAADMLGAAGEPGQIPGMGRTS